MLLVCLGNDFLCAYVNSTLLAERFFLAGLLRSRSGFSCSRLVYILREMPEARTTLYMLNGLPERNALLAGQLTFMRFAIIKKFGENYNSAQPHQFVFTDHLSVLFTIPSSLIFVSSKTLYCSGVTIKTKLLMFLSSVQLYDAVIRGWYCWRGDHSWPSVSLPQGWCSEI